MNIDPIDTQPSSMVSSSRKAHHVRKLTFDLKALPFEYALKVVESQTTSFEESLETETSHKRKL